MPERAPGFYWVKLLSGKPWSIAEWCVWKEFPGEPYATIASFWYIPGWEFKCDDDDFATIGPRLTPPDD